MSGAKRIARWTGGTSPHLGTALFLACALACGGSAGAGVPGSQDPLGAEIGPGPSPPDLYRPGSAGGELPPPRKGGRVIVHMEAMPRHLNYLVENSGMTRRVLGELHEFLVQRDWETWEHRPVLCERWDALDLVVTSEGERLVGRAEELEGGWRVTPPAQEGAPAGEARELAAGEVASVAPSTVYTFHLREGVRWHDGHPFDARDVHFTWLATKNPFVDCDEKRFEYDKIESAEILDGRTVRFFLAEPYFQPLAIFDGMTILPSHLYDLSDPDNPARKDSPSLEEQGRFVNEHPANRAWIGLGPYRLKEITSQFVEAERFEGYFDPENGGHVDSIRWRVVQGGDEVAFRALVNGELDFFARLTAEQYFGAATSEPSFTERFYKGRYYTPRMSYTTWNLRRQKFQDRRVRLALGMCFDWEEFIRTYYRGLAFRVTSEQNPFGPNYDRSIEPIPFDPGAAEELLAEAGWYDRDGDGIADKDGEPLSFELLLWAGNEVSEIFAQRYQETLAKVGVRMEIAGREWAALMQKVRSRDFDAAGLAWVMPIQSDPEQIWHSRWAGEGSANHAGLADPEVDRLIEAIHVELDDGRRAQLFHRLQARIYELQPYLFGVDVPHKFAIHRRIRNFQIFAIDPGYSIRRWWLEPGARGGEAPEGERRGR